MGVSAKESGATLPMGWLSMGGHFFPASTVTTVKPHGTDPTKSFVIHGTEKGLDQWATCDCTTNEAWAVVLSALMDVSAEATAVKRVDFAKEAMKGILANPDTAMRGGGYSPSQNVKHALEHADALLGALAEQGGQGDE